MRKPLITFLALVFFSGCASTAKRGIDENAARAASENSDEQAVGDEINREILSQFYPYTDPKVVKYLNDLGNELSSRAKRQDLHYRFIILYDEKIYATSAPGGYIYVTTGMLNFLQSEAELAAVLAHEIGRLQYKDPRFTKTDDAVSVMTQTGTAIAPMFGPFGSLAALGLVLLQAYVDSTQKTQDELLLESDNSGLQYLLKAGYDPQALIDLLERFLKAGGKVTPLFYDYYQSRPITAVRMENLKKEFIKLPLSDKDLKTDAFEYQEITKGIREIYKTSSNP